LFKIRELIEGISSNGDNTSISLLHVNEKIEDVIFMEEILYFVEEKKIFA